MKDYSRWVDVVNALSENPTARVRCPEKNDAELEVTDVLIEGDPERIERHLRCPACGANSAVLMRRQKPGQEDARR